MSLTFLAALGAAGGVGYAADNVHKATTAVRQAFGAGPGSAGGNVDVVSRRSGDDEYVEECRREVLLAIEAEFQRHVQALAAEWQLHLRLAAEAASTAGKDDDRAEKSRHRRAVKAEKRQHHAERHRLLKEFKRCDELGDG